MANVTPEFATLGQSYQALRVQKGHWDGEESNPPIDNFNGEKHQTMQKLGEYFGKPGTPAANILENMGQPDEVKQTMDEAFHASLMPGPVIGEGVATETKADQQAIYFVYKWRGNHDYLWFKIDPSKEEVIESAWYHAYE
ncbi:hypothetical protein B0O80DRAFT_485336 [Mortierella sp. GBAus27b]|nr:hypothetical protein BGX31_004575 [Mortierella sp. GBA43]KAI8358276.1 hypothetical protein B0O80DRAFT_485336 [Mortierella sp. GBAus27b]